MRHKGQGLAVNVNSLFCVDIGGEEVHYVEVAIKESPRKA